MNAFLIAAGLLFVASLLIANPSAFLRLADDLVTGIARFKLHLLGHRDLHPYLTLAPASLAAVRLTGAVIALFGLLVAALG